jgi:RsiW-degrading membrane proteinase PrsW (M82 family)
MLLLAASTLDKLKDVPKSVWLILGGIIVGLVLLIIILRKLAGVNKLVLTVVVLFCLSVFFFSWVYERNEPAFMTPVIDKVAPFFPAKDAYGGKQKSKPKGT